MSDKLSKRLKNLRESKGYLQKYVADKIGCFVLFFSAFVCPVSTYIYTRKRMRIISSTSAKFSGYVIFCDFLVPSRCFFILKKLKNYIKSC